MYVWPWQVFNNHSRNLLLVLAFEINPKFFAIKSKHHVILLCLFRQLSRQHGVPTGCSHVISLAGNKRYVRQTVGRIRMLMGLNFSCTNFIQNYRERSERERTQWLHHAWLRWRLPHTCLLPYETKRWPKIDNIYIHKRNMQLYLFQRENYNNM